jgi:hypothetical protein
LDVKSSVKPVKPSQTLSQSKLRSAIQLQYADAKFVANNLGEFLSIFSVKPVKVNQAY